METKVKINPKNGRVTFSHEALFPEGKWRTIYYQNYQRHHSYVRTYAIGFDILYCAETAELAFEIYRHEIQSKTSYEDKMQELRNVGATLWLKRDHSINIARYFKRIPELQSYRRHAVEQHDVCLREKGWASAYSWFDATLFESHITIKLDPSNTKTALLSQFKKIQLKRIKNESHEILLDASGYLRLPKSTLSMGKRVKVDIQDQQVTLTFGDDGDRAVRKDATLNIRTLLRPFKLTQKLYLPYYQENNRITFRLDGDDPKSELQALRSVKQALGLFD